ncbi:MAG: ribosomal RNA small subunit methyltransferase G [Saprospiraceae bacterium]|nr:MAG: ribosomal RNA small subunit methyltransferase G [Saprospiraceae bacterium]
MDLIHKYFPKLTPKQTEQFEQLGPLYQEWNQKINVISRKDIDNLYAHHILHAMAIAKIVQFLPKASILDLGTGGGLPGIPMAILFPGTQFTLVDGTRKKISVVEAIVEALQLDNVTPRHARAEELKQQFDFVICRAVASLDKLYEWSMPRIKTEPQLHSLPNGLITLKGGDIRSEMKALPRKSYSEIYSLSKFFEEPYYEGKCAVYVQR